MKKEKGNLQKLVSWMRPYRGKMTVCGAAVLVSNLAELINPMLTAIIIDDFLTAHAPQKGLYSVLGIASIYFCLQVIGSLCNMYEERLITRVSQSILCNMRAKVFGKIMNMSVPELEKNGTGRLITRSTNDVESINEFYSDVFINLFKDVFLLLGILVFMFSINYSLALVSLVGVPIVFGIAFSIKRVIKQNHKRIKKITGEINGFIAENISGMRLVHAYFCIKEKFAEFKSLNDKFYRASLLQMFFNSILRPSMEVINNLVIALLIAFSFNRISGGFLEVGVLYAFTSYVKKFFNPINDLADKYTTVQSAFVSMDRINEVLESENIEDTEKGEKGGIVKGDIEFRNVWFAYSDENWVLKGVSFHLKAGEKAAFVGATGVGKTTVINLINRYYVPQKGEILVDGVNVNSWRLSDLRSGCTTVLQDVFLFTGTIRENIDMHKGLTDEQIISALKCAEAESFLNLPKDLDYKVEEQGLNFSTGERQLLSFARAIAGSPAVLVLDEATAHIDTNTERTLQSAIENISSSRTCIFIAHRLSTIKHCNVIFVLKDGVIAESGTHNELLAIDGEYKSLVNAEKNNSLKS